jgi:hypothetical protein
MLRRVRVRMDADGPYDSREVFLGRPVSNQMTHRLVNFGRFDLALEVALSLMRWGTVVAAVM